MQFVCWLFRRVSPSQLVADETRPCCVISKFCETAVWVVRCPLIGTQPWGPPVILSVVLEVVFLILTNCSADWIVSRSQSRAETLRQSQYSEGAACRAVQTLSSVDLLGHCENWRGSSVEGTVALMWPGRILWKLFLIIFLES